MQSRNLAARAGRWSAAHRKTAILGWIAFVVLATLIGGAVGQKNLEASAMGNGESKRAELIVDAADFPEQIREQVLIQGKGAIKADDPQMTGRRPRHRQPPRADRRRPRHREPAGRRASREHRLQGRPLRSSSTSRCRASGRHGRPRPRSPRRRSPPSPPCSAPIPRCRVEEYGPASERARSPTRRPRTRRAPCSISLGGTLPDPACSRSAPRRAGVPLFLGITAFVATTGLLGPVSQIMPLHESVGQVTMLVGLAVGVDYAMFYLRRMMEERDKGRSADAALEVAAATSGRAVLISGLTVMAAMAGMFFSGNRSSSPSASGRSWSSAWPWSARSPSCRPCCPSSGARGWLEKGRVPWVAKPASPHGRRVARLERDPGPRPRPAAAVRRSPPAAS
jgi:RND superfamily putative drug exporter